MKLGTCCIKRSVCWGSSFRFSRYRAHNELVSKGYRLEDVQGSMHVILNLSSSNMLPQKIPIQWLCTAATWRAHANCAEPEKVQKLLSRKQTRRLKPYLCKYLGCALVIVAPQMFHSASLPTLCMMWRPALRHNTTTCIGNRTNASAKKVNWVVWRA